MKARSTAAARPRAARMASGGVIREAAARLFLDQGYQATSMDEIAATAQVSKQTIYTHFRNKEELFADLVMANAQTAEGFTAAIAGVLGAADLESALRDLARGYVRIVSSPEVLRLRRLVIGEAGRFPELASRYYEEVPGRVLDQLASLFAALTERGRLRIEDPSLAARQFAWLCVGAELDRGMFIAPQHPRAAEDLDRIADAALGVFLAAYGA